jgi:hypothetical protein
LTTICTLPVLLVVPVAATLPSAVWVVALKL